MTQPKPTEEPKTRDVAFAPILLRIRLPHPSDAGDVFDENGRPVDPRPPFLRREKPE